MGNLSSSELPGAMFHMTSHPVTFNVVVKLPRHQLRSLSPQFHVSSYFPPEVSPG